MQVPQKLLRRWCQAAIITINLASRWQLPKKIEISLILTDDAGISVLNKEYRDKDVPTDVLSFPIWAVQPFKPKRYQTLPLGDIIISLDRAREQAKEYDHSLEREAVFLFVHGLLHLLGYDHELSVEDEQEMFRLQEKIMNELGLGLNED